jgi:hypothetical protein
MSHDLAAAAAAAARPAEGAGASAGEIEITPAMTKAGAAVLCRYDRSQEEYWADQVYRAMRQAADLQQVARSTTADVREDRPSTKGG